jgi:malonyl-CoA O-methyltransferase
MNIQHSFSHNAYAYDDVNIIQKQVLETLIAKIDDSPAHILDIGCGRGGVYEAIGWEIETFTGMDFAEGMLSLHPKADTVTLLLQDFNDPYAFEKLKSTHFDRIISSSALQWASDLDTTLSHIASLKAPVSLSIFTANTFKTLYETAGIPPLLQNREEITSLLTKHFPDAQMETLHYTLQFASVREMFRYMKKSGVGAGRNILGYRKMKQLMTDYPLDHLEYEIILLHESA